MASKAERTKQHIVEKAAPLFNTQGYAGTSLRDIMRVTGLTKGGIYGNFVSKDEIAAAVFDYSFQRLRAALSAVVAPPPTAVGKLLAILQFYHNYTLTPTIAGGCPLLNSSIEIRAGYPILQQQVSQAVHDTLEDFQRILQFGIKQKELRPDIDPRKEAVVLYGQSEGGMVMSRATADPRLLNRMLGYIREHILGNLVV